MRDGLIQPEGLAMHPAISRSTHAAIGNIAGEFQRTRAESSVPTAEVLALVPRIERGLNMLAESYELLLRQHTHVELLVSVFSDLAHDFARREMPRESSIARAERDAAAQVLIDIEHQLAHSIYTERWMEAVRDQLTHDRDVLIDDRVLNPAESSRWPSGQHVAVSNMDIGPHAVAAHESNAVEQGDMELQPAHQRPWTVRPWHLVMGAALTLIVVATAAGFSQRR
jgi:hypothetical protein